MAVCAKTYVARAVVRALPLVLSLACRMLVA